MRRFADLSFGVFDLLCLVENDDVELALLIPRFVTTQERVTRYDNVGVSVLFERLGAVRPVDRDGLQFGDKFGSFLDPVENKSRRTNDEAFATDGIEE